MATLTRTRSCSRPLAEAGRRSSWVSVSQFPSTEPRLLQFTHLRAGNAVFGRVSITVANIEHAVRVSHALVHGRGQPSCRFYSPLASRFASFFTLLRAVELMRLTSLFCCVTTTPDILDSDTAASKPAKTPPKAKPAVDPSKSTPYTPERAADLFSQYADEDDADVIGPEGFEKLSTEAGISLEGALPLILAWQLGGTELAKIKKAEWEKGTAELK